MVNKFFKKVLKNGMVVFLEKRDLPVVSVAYAVRSGGMNEEESEKGISHFIEHMLFKGTKKRKARQIAAEIEQKGGELNAFTDEDITAFWCKMPSNHLDVALDVLTDMIKNSVFAPKELEKERKVIFEEIKMRKDSPNIYVLDKIQEFLYEKPLGITLIGTYGSMNSITREKIIKRYKEVYRPNNLILGVVGNADFDEIVKFAEKNFGKEKGDGKSYLPKILKRNEISKEKRKGIDQVNLVLAFHIPLIKKQKYAAYLLNTLMASGMSSRLFTEIREKRNLAYEVMGDYSLANDFGYLVVYVGTSKGNEEKVKDLILEEFQKVSKTLTEKELNIAREQIIGDYEVSSENSRKQLHDLLQEEIDGDGAGNLYNLEKNLRKVTLKEVKELATFKNYSFFVLVPE